MTSRALIGLAQGLGQGVADVGKMAFAAQIEEQRMARLRQYQKEDYQQQRADKKEDYQQQRADTRADLEDQRGWQSENEQRLYERGRADSEADYQRNRRDAVADRAHSEARADRAAQMAAQLKADKWSSLQPVKSRDEFGNEQITGFVGSKGGSMQMIDLQSGRIIPLADDQQRMAALSQLAGYEVPGAGQEQPQAQQPAQAQVPQAAAPAPAQQKPTGGLLSLMGRAWNGELSGTAPKPQSFNVPGASYGAFGADEARARAAYSSVYGSQPKSADELSQWSSQHFPAR